MFHRTPSKSIGINEMLKKPEFARKTILKDMLPVKQSTVILDFAKPLLDKIDMSNKAVLEKTIKTAIEAWNFFITADRAAAAASPTDKKRLQKMAFVGVARQKLSYPINEKDYRRLFERKEELYPDNHYFIIDHNIKWSADGSEFSLSVMTNDASGIDVKPLFS